MSGWKGSCLDGMVGACTIYEMSERHVMRREVNRLSSLFVVIWACREQAASSIDDDNMVPCFQGTLSSVAVAQELHQ